MLKLKSRFKTLSRRAMSLSVFRVSWTAARNYINHQSANQAGSVAFSSVLSLFPLLILLSAAAAYVGRPGSAAELVGRAIGYAPKLVRDAVQPVIDEVIAQRNQTLLTIGLFITLWTASSGMQAIRTALNRAYGVEQGVPFWKARIKVTVFTVVAGSCTLVTFSSLIIMPHVWQLLISDARAVEESIFLHNSVRYGTAFVVTTLVYGVLYGWLPDIRQRLLTVLPGALVGAALWTGAAASLSYSFNTAGKLALLYGGFAGVVATLVFLYISASTLIFGAEVNGVLHAESDFNTDLRGQEEHASPGKKQLIARAPRRR